MLQRKPRSLFYRPAKGTIFLVVFCLSGLSACKKYEDKPGQYDPRLSSKYCNDPAAVNYNYGFPGTPDNSVCFYPADVFQGSYQFVDSIYSNDKLVAEVPLVLQASKQDETRFVVTGFCNGSTLKFTANRALFAYADTVVGNGQVLCRPQDTLSGTLIQRLSDSVRLSVYFTVSSDTGSTIHQGTAYRQ
ncbi:MAG: hypothetical protein JST06_06905 [Bacteroidetes bacterium]|nr:hypothetical protein [Bacteroidota bacterium]MBS1629020.1 hypothetical protein [Bacteroidota bacterium]